MAVKNAASALGGAIGKLIEDELERTLRPLCERYSYVYDRGGARPDKRKGVKLAMVNRSGNSYQLDGVIEAADGSPIVLLESKYLRYKKHNRDKASWTCASHYSLRKSHPTIRKSIAVLSGFWSAPSKAFMESFGIELHQIPFPLMCAVLGEFGIEFNWAEKDALTPRNAWETFLPLPGEHKSEIGKKLVDSTRDALTDSVETTLSGGEDWARHLNQLEVLLKTDRNEFHTYEFASVRDALYFLMTLQEEADDLRGRL